MTQLEAIGKSHRPLDFGNLQHSHSWSPSLPLNEAEPIKSGEGAQGSIKRLPSTCSIRSVVDDEKVLSSPKFSNPVFYALDCRTCAPCAVYLRRLPILSRIKDRF